MARPKQTTSPNRRQQILEQAAGLFKTNGFNATTMRQLAEQTGMEAASLYNHISSKEELLREICFSVANDFNAHLLQLEADDSCASRKMAAIIQHGIDTGKFKAVHPHVAVLTMLSAVRSIEYWQRSKKAISSKQIADDLVMMLLKGLEQ